jgi:hypothetical protein
MKICKLVFIFIININIRSLLLFCSLVGVSRDGIAADEIHWTITGQTSVTFDWRGTDEERSIRYGTAPETYIGEIIAESPSPLPFSSSGPFWEARLINLQPNTLYYYSIAHGQEHTFRTPLPSGSSDFIVAAEADVGDSTSYSRMTPIQNLIKSVEPDFVLIPGDLTYANSHGQTHADQHFNDVMVWSQDTAYMPAWGNHEWDTPSTDDMRNYKGRFDFANPHTSPIESYPSGTGEDWYWFDYGNTRFIAFPEPFASSGGSSNSTDWSDWNTNVDPIMAQAQSDPNITFIVTFGHRPAYSSGHHTGSSTLQGIMNRLGDKYSKYILNLNGHSHDYERSFPQHGVVHISVGPGGSSLEEDGSCLWLTCVQPAWSDFRAMHHGILNLHFTASGIQGAFLCGPAGDTSSNINDITCNVGEVVDSFTIGTPTNQAPTVNAGTDQSVTFPNSTSLNGTVTDDGLPAGSTVTTTWSAVSGPGTVTFADSNAKNTTATFSVAGSYVLRLTANDSLLSSFDEIAITVNTSDSGTNLTHHWKFDETSGTTAPDSIGTNNITLSNSVLVGVAGKIGNAASFNGSNASGDAGKIDFGTGNFTVAHWVNVNGFKTYPAIFNNRSSASGNIGFHTRTDGTRTITALIDLGTTSKRLAVTNLATGTWYHIAVSVDRAGLMKLYINGALTGQVDISAFKTTSITNTDNVRIGRDQSSNYFNGVIDELRIYNTALSASEIFNLYKQ